MTILRTETGEKLFELENKFHTSSIININWSLYTADLDIKNISPIKKSSLIDQIIMPLSPHIYSDKY